MATPAPYTYQISKPTIGNGVGKVSSAYKNANQNNALTTITVANPTGYVPVDPNSTNTIIQNTSYAIQTDGKITYKVDLGTTSKQYNSIQEIADAGIVGYNATTTTQIKSAMSSNLSNQVTLYNTSNPTSKIGPVVATSPTPSDSPKPTVTEDVPGKFENLEIVENFGTSAEDAKSYNPDGKEAWVYPTGLGENKQDYIKFDMISYGPRKGITASGNIGKRSLGEKGILGTVFLPIQPSITDQNTVDWQNDTINPLQLSGTSVALAFSQGSNAAGATESAINQFMSGYTGKDADAVKQYLRYWAAGKAVGTNLFSRIAGATVNPNLELLFNGPQLRPFNFSFRLSPRDEKEAETVKGIIRFFKKGMAVDRSNKLFLKAPNVFEIKYINGKGGEHTSLNKIKVCALTSCSVDYTPDGSYATFTDTEATMTSYNLTLQFNELEPIFKDEYDSNKTSIGY
jgi:hypothetical protein